MGYILSSQPNGNKGALPAILFNSLGFYALGERAGFWQTSAVSQTVFFWV